MEESVLLVITVALLIVCIILSIILVLYGRQVKSICRQLQVHRKEESNTDFWLDVVPGPFRELQKELNLYEKEKRNREREYHNNEAAWQELVSNVSHDIRTPITSVAGYFQLLLETEDEGKKKKYASIISGRLKNFQDMLEEFFIYSTAASRDRKVEMECFDAVRVVSDTLFLYYDDIEEKFGAPEIIFPEKARVYAVSGDLIRIMTNVVKNALVHGTDHLKVEIEQAAEVVLLRVENGVLEPLSEEDVARVFDRTYRMSRSRTEGGTGLGLCIVKELAEQMGANVSSYCKDEMTFGIQICFKAARYE